LPLIAEHVGGADYWQPVVAVRVVGWRKHRAVCRARSRADFISKVGIVVEEADEAVFWLELLVESGIVPTSGVTLLIKEANELLAIFAASQLTAKQHAA